MRIAASSNTVWNTLGTPEVFQTVLELLSRSRVGGVAVCVLACVFEVGAGSGLVALGGGAGGVRAVAAGGVGTGSATRRAGCSVLSPGSESVHAATITDPKGCAMARTVHMGARVPVELAEAARKAAGLSSSTEVIRYALARLTDLDPDEHARHRQTGRPRKVAAA